MKLIPFAEEDLLEVESFDALVEPNPSRPHRILVHNEKRQINTNILPLSYGHNLFGNSNDTNFIKNKAGKWLVRPAKSFYLENVVLFPYLPLIVTQDGRYISETAEYFPEWGDISKVDHRFSNDGRDIHLGMPHLVEAEQRPPIDELSLFTSTIAKNNYGHFLFDCLVTGFCQRQALFGMDHRVIWPIMSDWQQTMIKLCDLSGTEFFKPVRLKRVVTNSNVSRHLPYPTELSRPLFDILRFKHGADKTAPTKIYVRRPPGSKRDFGNREQVEKILNDRGYTFFDPLDYDFLAQIRMFSNAKIVIGITGAGMANSFFAKSGCEIIEIMPDSYPDFWLRASCHQFGNRWNVITCRSRQFDATEERKSIWPGARDFSYDIPISELVLALTTIEHRVLSET